MLCYKDRTFCKDDTCHYFTLGCHRALTKKIKQDAHDFGLPISVMMPQEGEHLDCWKQIRTK